MPLVPPGRHRLASCGRFFRRQDRGSSSLVLATPLECVAPRPVDADATKVPQTVRIIDKKERRCTAQIRWHTRREILGFISERFLNSLILNDLFCIAYFQPAFRCTKSNTHCTIMNTWESTVTDKQLYSIASYRLLHRLHAMLQMSGDPFTGLQ